MGYRVFEYIMFVGVVLGFATLMFVSSLVVMLVREGFAHVFRAGRRLPVQVRKSAQASVAAIWKEAEILV